MIGHLKRRFGVGPQNWDRFKQEGPAPTDASQQPYLPPSGAHVSLSDLARDPSTIRFPSDDDPAVRAAMEGDDGWVGTPDPTKFAPGTTQLSGKELKEEVAKGNVMLWKDFKRDLEELDSEGAEAIAALAKERLMKERLFVTLKDGSKVSVWDLYEYVYNNPEMEELAARGRNIPTVDPNDPAGRLLPPAPPSAVERSAGLPVVVMGREEAREEEADWGHVARGAVWRRRPTHWLLGLDGVKDWEVDCYTHEPMANQVLGRKYGGKDPNDVIKDPSYARDVLRCGPLLGMTFVLTAARDMSLQELASSWRDRLAAYLQAQAPLSLPTRLRPTLLDPTDLNAEGWFQRVQELRASGAAPSAEEAAADADDLGVCWRTQTEPEHAASREAARAVLASLPSTLCPPGEDVAAWPLTGTSLVDAQTSRTWRQGGSLWLTLEPEGNVTLQAQSGGMVAEQESYLLGRLEGQEALSGAVMEAFLGPRPLDPDMAASGRAMMLLPANGFTAGNIEGDPNHPRNRGAARLPKLRPDPSAFRLAPLRRGGPAPTTVVSGIRDYSATNEVLDLLERAAAAARDASTSSSPESKDGSASASASAAASASAREAAIRVLREGYSGLGPEARRLIQRSASLAASPAGNGVVSDSPLVVDLFSLARQVDGADA